MPGLQRRRLCARSKFILLSKGEPVNVKPICDALATLRTTYPKNGLPNQMHRYEQGGGHFSNTGLSNKYAQVSNNVGEGP